MEQELQILACLVGRDSALFMTILALVHDFLIGFNNIGLLGDGKRDERESLGWNGREESAKEKGLVRDWKDDERI
ncbi:hypothetical protein TNCV_3891241 [Trichonephila clavipes]|nr:hypothetical protein TNCV_3891241 [Trichonephila clavipes]